MTKNLPSSSEVIRRNGHATRKGFRWIVGSDRTTTAGLSNASQAFAHEGSETAFSEIERWMCLGRTSEVRGLQGGQPPLATLVRLRVTAPRLKGVSVSGNEFRPNLMDPSHADKSWSQLDRTAQSYISEQMNRQHA